MESAQALETNRRLEHEMGRLAANRDEVCRDKLELETGDQIITRSNWRRWSNCGGATRSLQPDTRAVQRGARLGRGAEQAVRPGHREMKNFLHEKAKTRRCRSM